MTEQDKNQEAKDALTKGTKEFLGIPLLVESGVLIPREETELLGQKAIDVLAAEGGESLIAIDMCCGAGNLACAIAKKIDNVQV